MVELDPGGYGSKEGARNATERMGEAVVGDV